MRRCIAAAAMAVVLVTACGESTKAPSFDERAARDYWQSQYPDLSADGIQKLVMGTRDTCNDPDTLRAAAGETTDGDHEDIEQYAASCPDLLDAARSAGASSRSGGSAGS